MTNLAIVRSIAEEFDHLRPFPKARSPVPTTTALGLTFFLHYEDEPPVVVEVAFTGRWVARNGRADAVVPTLHLQRRLKNLAPV